MQGCAELQTQAVDYLTRNAGLAYEPVPETVVLVVDVAADAAALQAIKQALLQVGLLLCTLTVPSTAPHWHCPFNVLSHDVVGLNVPAVVCS